MLQKSMVNVAGVAVSFLLLPRELVSAVLPPPEYEGRPGRPRIGALHPMPGRPERDSPTQLVPSWGKLVLNCAIIRGVGSWASGVLTHSTKHNASVILRSVSYEAVVSLRSSRPIHAKAWLSHGKVAVDT